MDIYLQPIMVNDSLKGADDMSENLVNPVFKHLTDHDYVTKKVRTYVKKSNKHLKITKLKAIYNCTTCGYRSMNHDAHNNHICKRNILKRITKKIPEGYEKCSKCNLDMSKKLEAVSNTERNSLSSDYRCSFLPTHVINRSYKCTTCNYITEKLTSLKVHMHVHSRGSPFKCSECLYSASNLKELLKHYDTVKDLKCECGFSTHIKQHMARHLRSHKRKTP